MHLKLSSAKMAAILSRGRWVNDVVQRYIHQSASLEVKLKCCRYGHLVYSLMALLLTLFHDDVIKWKHFRRYWPFVRGIHRLTVNSPHKDQWRGALMFTLICALNKQLSKQSRGWWFKTPLRSLWRHCNVTWCSSFLFMYHLAKLKRYIFKTFVNVLVIIVKIESSVFAVLACFHTWSYVFYLRPTFYLWMLASYIWNKHNKTQIIANVLEQNYIHFKNQLMFQ